MRESQVVRNTAETQISIALNVDGKGNREISTGCGFLDHMLDLFARHGDFDLKIKCVGDLQVDGHHTTEDVGIALGQAFLEALGEKRGIIRYGDIILPMDEALILVSLDLSGRGGAYVSLEMPTSKVGDFDTELCAEFLYAFARVAGITLHVKQLDGENSHHIIEGVFKGLARALKKAVSIDANHVGEIPSTKGVL